MKLSVISVNYLILLVYIERYLVVENTPVCYRQLIVTDVS